MADIRRERIARIIREEASRVVLYELGDPRIGFVTVTKVKVSADLSHARVYVSVYGDDAVRQATMKALSRAVRVVQRSCGPRLKTRIIPHIQFEFDPSVEGAIHISQLIGKARASDPDGGKAGAPADQVPAESAEADGPAVERDEGAGSEAASSGQRCGPDRAASSGQRCGPDRAASADHGKREPDE